MPTRRSSRNRRTPFAAGCVGCACAGGTTLRRACRAERHLRGRTEESAMFRLFVGIALPQEVRARLSVLCVRAGRRQVGRSRQPAPDAALHRRGRRRSGRGHRRVAAAGVTAPAFDLVLTGVDCFEAAARSHTLWTGVDKQPLLAHLRDKVELAVVRAGCEPERRKFKPHVTLARFAQRRRRRASAPSSSATTASASGRLRWTASPCSAATSAARRRTTRRWSTIRWRRLAAVDLADAD